MPVHAPLHPAKVEPELEVAVRVIEELEVKLAEHVLPQLMPDGLLVTVPEPVPLVLTVNEYVEVDWPNVAVTDRVAAIETVHVPVPLQAPDQPAKREPELGVAVSVTDVPELKLTLHVLPQLMPLGLLVTVPLPVPLIDTTRL